jgi:carboxyl-terminal processing protease
MHRDSAILLLQGEAGTSLHLEVERRSDNAQLRFDVVRDFVASPSIGSALMLNDTTAYVRINNFARSTPQDLRVALAELQGFEHLIIDLRGNTGGLLPSVVNICGMFLQSNALIVTTEGRAEPTHEYRTKYAGEYSDIPLTILIDEHTASASEIFAGAMQDNDRAVVIGRTSYGKGLVQRLINIGDDCGIAVTRARYKTPSGRTIQRPYTKGDKRGYHNDSMRYNHPDSIRRDRGEVFYTLNEHREVYGGGGITPDIYIAEEMIDTTSYRGRALKQNVVSEVVVDIFDREGYTNFMSHYPTFEAFATLFTLDDASRSLIEYTMAGSEATDSDREWLCDMIRARIAYDIYGEEAYIDIYKMYDEPLIQALYLHK